MAAVSSFNVIENTSNQPWAVAVSPFPVADQIYYIGNLWVGAYLIDTGDGLIILDTMCAETAYLVVDSIYRLGYRPADIKMILISHAHIDHHGAARFLKELSGAKIYLSGADDEFRKNERASSAKSGGVGNILFRSYDYEVDEYYDDSTPIVLGNVKITTRLTPGHTPGCTSFFIEAPQKDGTVLTAAMHGGVGVLTMSDEYFEESGLSPELRRTFIADCEALKQYPVDICLASHPAHYPGNFFELPKKSRENGNPFIDKNAWTDFLENRVKFAVDLEEKSRNKK